MIPAKKRLDLYLDFKEGSTFKVDEPVMMNRIKFMIPWKRPCAKFFQHGSYFHCRTPRIKRWFGYILHVIPDTRHEILGAVHVTPASVLKHTQLRSMIKETFKKTPEPGERCDDFVADRGLDTIEAKALLLDKYGIRTAIDIRELWREEKLEPGYDPEKPFTPPLYPERFDTILYV